MPTAKTARRAGAITVVLGLLATAGIYVAVAGSAGVPAPTITSGPANPTNQSSATLAFTDSQSGVSFICSLDGAAYAACTSPQAYSGLVAGNHTFKVEAKNSAG